MKGAFQRMDWGTRITIFLTLALFIIALFVKGFGHGLLLEAGVFLVSVKLVMLAHHNQVSNERIQSQLEDIQSQLRNGPPAREAAAQAISVGTRSTASPSSRQEPK